MIVSGTVPSAPVQGVTVQGPADVNPPNGAGVMAQNGKWVLNPGESFVLAALGTAVATATASMIVDWTTAGCFAVTAYGGGWTITFNNAAGQFTPQLGQAILLNITHAASSAITWPSTITWFGPSSAAPTTTTNNCLVALVCTGTGSAPTFIGWVVAQVS
jgi:hypothetical protein